MGSDSCCCAKERVKETTEPTRLQPGVVSPRSPNRRPVQSGTGALKEDLQKDSGHGFDQLSSSTKQ